LFITDFFHPVDILAVNEFLNGAPGTNPGDVQLELPLGLDDEKRRPGTKTGLARWTGDCAMDKIRDRFGWQAVEYGSALGFSRSVPDEFRELAEKDL